MIYAVALIAFLSAVFWGIADFVSRKPSANAGYYSTAFYVQLFGFIGLGSYFAITNTLPIAHIVENPSLFAISLIVGVISFGGSVLLYRGYLIGTMSIVAPIAGSYPVFTIILSILLLGTIINVTVATGITVVLIGMILTATKLSELKNLGRRTKSKSTSIGNSSLSSDVNQAEKLKIGKGVDMAVLTFFLLGTVFFGLALITGVFGYLFPVMVIRGVGALCAFCLFIPLKQKLNLPKGTTLLWLVLLSTCDTSAFALFSYAVALAQESLPIIVTLSAQFSAITVILARIFYREKLEVVQYVGIVLILFGIGVTLYF
jgi:drug/metabolite transporter (DMT)-like permease